MALIFWWSSIPNLAVPYAESSFVQTLSRKLVHLVVFGMLAALLRWALPAIRGRWLVAFVGAVLYGISDEIHQSFVPTREGAAIDIAVDAVGALGALLLTATVEVRSRLRPEARENSSRPRAEEDAREAAIHSSWPPLGA